MARRLIIPSLQIPIERSPSSGVRAVWAGEQVGGWVGAGINHPPLPHLVPQCRFC